MLPPSPASPTTAFGATRRRALVALWLATVFHAAVWAQPPADFSGRWTLEAPAIASTAAVPGTPASATRSVYRKG